MWMHAGGLSKHHKVSPCPSCLPSLLVRNTDNKDANSPVNSKIKYIIKHKLMKKRHVNKEHLYFDRLVGLLHGE